MIDLPPLYAHQAEGIRLGLKHGSFLFADEPGTGKTRIALRLIEELPGPAIVLCPLSIIETAWREDAAKFTPNARVASLWAPTPARRAKALKQKADIYVVNYAGFRVIFRRHADWLRTKRFQVIVVDESSKINKPTSSITKAVLKFATDIGRGPYWPTIPHRFLMCGTPAPNSEMEYWSQATVVKPGLLHESFFVFRKRWFHALVSDPTNPRIVWKWAIDDRPALMKKLACCVRFVRKEDCLDLPDHVEKIRHVNMEPDQKRAYHEMLDFLVTSLEDRDLTNLDAGDDSVGGDVVMAANALAKLMKLRQITAGCARPLDGAWRWQWNAKIKALKELLDGELAGEQAIIWTQFVPEAAAIMAALCKEPHDRVWTPGQCAALFTGATPTSVRPDIIRAFQRNEIQYLVSHPATAGHGLTLTSCCHGIYTSLDYRPDHLEQTQGRIHRATQKRTCVSHYLICPGTIDETLLATLRRKGNVSRMAADMIRAARKEH